MINAIVKLNSELRVHGIKDSKSRVATQTGAISKLRKSLGREAGPQPTSGTKEREILPLDHQPKAYGSHDGNNHGAIIAKFSGSQDELMDWLCNIDLSMATFESAESIDIKQMKEDYRVKRDAITREIFQTYGSNVDARGTAKYDDLVSRIKFSYTKSQVTIILYSTEEFNGSTLDKRRNLYVAAYKSKSVYTQGLLKADFIRNLVQIASGGFDAGIIKRSRQQLPGVVYTSSRGAMKIQRIAASNANVSSIGITQVVIPESWKVAELNDLK